MSKAIAKSRVLWLQRAAVANMSKSPKFLCKAGPHQAAVPIQIWGRILAFPAPEKAHQFAKQAIFCGKQPNNRAIAAGAMGEPQGSKSTSNGLLFHRFSGHLDRTARLR